MSISHQPQQVSYQHYNNVVDFDGFLISDLNAYLFGQLHDPSSVVGIWILGIGVKYYDCDSQGHESTNIRK